MSKQQEVAQLLGAQEGRSVELMDYDFVVGYAAEERVNDEWIRQGVMTPRPGTDGYKMTWDREPEAIANDLRTALDDAMRIARQR